MALHLLKSYIRQVLLFTSGGLDHGLVHRRNFRGVRGICAPHYLKRRVPYTPLLEAAFVLVYRCTMYYVLCTVYCVRRNTCTVESACSWASELIFNHTLPQSDLRPRLGFATELVAVSPTFWTKVTPLVLLFWSWSLSCKQRSWSCYFVFGIGLVTLVLVLVLLFRSWSWSCYFGLGLVSSGLGLGLGLSHKKLVSLVYITARTSYAAVGETVRCA